MDLAQAAGANARRAITRRAWRGHAWRAGAPRAPAHASDRAPRRAEPMSARTIFGETRRCLWPFSGWRWGRICHCACTPAPLPALQSVLQGDRPDRLFGQLPAARHVVPSARSAPLFQCHPVSLQAHACAPCRVTSTTVRSSQPPSAAMQTQCGPLDPALAQCALRVAHEYEAIATGTGRGVRMNARLARYARRLAKCAILFSVTCRSNRVCAATIAATNLLAFQRQ